MFSKALLRTFRTLTSPHFLALLIKTALITLIGFSCFIVLIVVALRATTLFTSDYEWMMDIFLGMGAVIIGWLLLPVLVPMIAAFFQESIANRIEERDYPEFMPPAVERPWHVELWEDSKFVLLLLGLNILCLPLFLIPVVNLFTYYGLNSYLIGREFFETVGARHIGKVAAKKLRKENRMPALLAGFVIVVLANVPIVNLATPFIGVALMVHLYHALPKQEVLKSPYKG